MADYGQQQRDPQPATLHALDASNLADELWNSDLNGARDQPGLFMKFAPPTVVNGRVYVPTESNAVAVYGPLGTPATSGPAVITSVVNSASFLEGAVSPGELVTIFGANLGPTSAAEAQLNGDVVADRAESTQVLIGGVAAPLLYASPTQINTVVPFGVSGATTDFQVVYQGQTTASVTMPVQAASPAVFSADTSGGGQGAILNQDGSVNTQTNAAAPGSVVVLYITGAGLTTPASQDAVLTPSETNPSAYPVPALPVSVTIFGLPAKVLYAGAAPGIIAGVLQLNVVVPAGAYPATYDQIVVSIGDYVSPSAVTLTVK